MQVNREFLVQIQGVSGLAFGSFCSLHLLTALSGNLTEGAFNGSVEFFRLLYSPPKIEQALLLSAVTHFSSSIALRLSFPPSSPPPSPLFFSEELEEREKRMEREVGEWESGNRWHRYSGYIVAGTVVPHVIGNRIIPHKIFGVPADYSFVSYTLRYHPWISYPIFLGIGAAGAYHFCSGVIRALANLNIISKKAKKGKSWVGILLGVGVVCGVIRIGLSEELFQDDEWRLLSSLSMRELVGRLY